jgi:UDP-N-acetylglucosamine 2-epimerase (non-hydrolysing)
LVSNQFGFAPKSVAVVLGTRPEIIKLAHCIRLLDDAALIVHTGQHYDPKLSGSFFPEFGLPEPDVFLEVGGSSRGHQIGEATSRLDALFAEYHPVAVMVQGDTNAVVAGAIAANARGVFLCHVEAGLRSFDRLMPEEHNRVIADHLSDLCCAPTPVNVKNLAAEGISGDRVVETGNTVVEAVMELLPSPEVRKELCARYDVEPGRFVLSTFHRPENVDDPDNYRAILEELAKLPIPVLLPLHPRSVRRASEHGLEDLLDQIRVTEPIGYREFLGLEAESALLISDSGGVQEEASIVKRPVIVVRNSTERPEVIGTFATRVLPGPDIGEASRPIIDDVEGVHAGLAELASPYGDGTASHRSLEALAERIS